VVYSIFSLRHVQATSFADGRRGATVRMYPETRYVCAHPLMIDRRLAADRNALLSTMMIVTLSRGFTDETSCRQRRGQLHS
jgi:hypothetical protein